MKTLFQSTISLFFLSLFVIFAVGSSDDSETTEEAKEKLSKNAVKVTAIDMLNQLKDNEVKFMKQYKDKTVEVTGTITGFDTGLSDDDVIVKVGERYDYVRCTVVKDQADKAANYSKGQTITIKGICTGEVMGYPGMKSCIIVE